jgi:hypothetical protein
MVLGALFEARSNTLEQGDHRHMHAEGHLYHMQLTAIIA